VYYLFGRALNFQRYLVAILDADKEGFLVRRDLIQTMGRAPGMLKEG
jgi:excinuclease UvrABC helicase subunit UvrB